MSILNDQFKPELQRRLLLAVLAMLLLLGAVGRWDITLALLLLILGVLGLRWRAQFKTCPCCDGQGRIHRHSAYVDATFTGQVCYFCKGEKFIHPKHNHWHHLWEQANLEKRLLMQEKRLFRDEQIRLRQAFGPYIMRNSSASVDSEYSSQFEQTVSDYTENFERLIQYYFEIEQFVHRIMFQNYREYAAQYCMEYLEGGQLKEKFYRATELEDEALILKKYDYEIQGLEKITGELRKLQVPQALIVELEASTERLRQERDIA